VNPKFIRYYTISSEYRQWIENCQDGSTRGNMNANTFANMEIKLPSRERQDLIARTLSLLDDKIELNRKINTELEKMARAIYDYTFVQPTNNKPLPNGWEVKKLENICERIQSGGTPSRVEKSYFNGDINWYTTGELSDEPILESIEKITKIAIENSSAKMFSKGTIMIAIYASPTAGKLGIMTEDGSFNQAITGIVPKENIPTEFIFLTLLIQKPRLLSMASGTAQKNLSNQIVKDFEILVPDSETLSHFQKTVRPIFAQLIKNRQESAELAKLRDFLLPMLMNGEVSI
jgi:type I restriction enzyme S subunit